MTSYTACESKHSNQKSFGFHIFLSNKFTPSNKFTLWKNLVISVVHGLRIDDQLFLIVRDTEYASKLGHILNRKLFRLYDWEKEIWYHFWPLAEVSNRLPDRVQSRNFPSTSKESYQVYLIINHAIKLQNYEFWGKISKIIKILSCWHNYACILKNFRFWSFVFL